MHYYRLRSSSVILLMVVLSGCWSDPALVKIQSIPPGAQVWFDERQLGVTPLQTILECDSDIQFLHFELMGHVARERMLIKRPIYYVFPWYTGIGAGLFSFSTTWRSRACTPSDISVELIPAQSLDQLQATQSSGKRKQ